MIQCQMETTCIDDSPNNLHQFKFQFFQKWEQRQQIEQDKDLQESLPSSLSSVSTLEQSYKEKENVWGR